MIEKNSSKWLNWNLEKKKKKLTETLEITLNLYKQKKSIKEIAKKREFKIQTVEYQLVELVTLGFISIFDILSDKKFKHINLSLELGMPKSLKKIKEVLPKNISYFEIKCFLANLNREPKKINLVSKLINGSSPD